ncbi:ABC transporter ATP-binding protein, partial [Alcaligenes faecalis subsp. faecalis NCIB 8687]
GTESRRNAGLQRASAIKWLERVGIPAAAQRYDDFPFQFSGGQKQRIMIDANGELPYRQIPGRTQ